MRLRRRLHRVFFVALLVFAASRLPASEVRLIDGTTYSGVTIVRRDARSVEIVTQYGRVELPMVSVDRIDGVRVVPLATPVPHTPPPHASAAPAASAPASTPGPIPSTTPSPTAAETLPKPMPAPTHPSIQVAPQPAEGLPPWVYFSALPAGAGLLLIAILLLRRRKLADFRTAASTAEDFIFLDEEHQPIAITGHEEGSGIELARSVLQSALFDRASDVHVEPAGGEYRVRFRVDGLMQNRAAFPNERGIQIVTALKNLAQTDIAERRKAQDGRFGARTGGQEVDFRVATTPSVYGEKLVVRILDRKAGPRGLDDLGMSQAMRERFAQTIHSRNGLILVTGPTGSGKTSTLYAALQNIDAQRLNLVTIEDPVEYRLEGATQIPVNVRAGITFESGLKSILRQDPDVILVGEMRDLEAGQIALRSSLTGHLVFSSLHARDAIGAVLRMEEMGIERALLSSALFVVLAQRLVRILCAQCRVPTTCAGDELEEIGLSLPAGHAIYRAGSCPECGGRGYAGRTGVFELLVFDDELRQAVASGLDEETLIDLARGKGYRPYREDAAEKVLLGITSVEEALQAI